jgi:hypothetical protein
MVASKATTAKGCRVLQVVSCATLDLGNLTIADGFNTGPGGGGSATTEH